MSRRQGQDLSSLEERLGYRFRNTGLLKQALTHPSAVATHRRRDETYQRLEFLGDRVLGLAVAATLTETFPEADEGELSRRLNRLVRQEACAVVAEKLGVGPHLRLGAGESQSGGRRKVAILADVAEALIAAIYLDGGWPEALAAVHRHWEPHVPTPQAPLRDAKTMLQEWVQGRGLPPPIYREVERLGPDHNPEFLIAVAIEGLVPAEGRGRSKRIAEQNAAGAMLYREGVWVETVEADGPAG